MKYTHLFTTLLLFLIGGIAFAEVREEVKVSPKTEAVALFKNGYTVVRQEIDIPSSGTYRWEDVPPIVHGTFFIESDMNVEVQTTQRRLFVTTTERMEQRPVVLFHVTKDGKGGNGKIRLSYLTKGAAWMPSYRIDLLDGKRLRIEQAAAIRNEGLPFTDAEIALVSGFPQIECMNVLSPIMPGQTLAQFVQQISGHGGAFVSDGMLSQSRMLSNSAEFERTEERRRQTANLNFDSSALNTGEGPDIHYNAIGKRSLETGDTLSLTVGKGEVDYRRVLECDLASSVLDQYYNRGAYNQLVSPDVFDVLKFTNPLPFPITTAPAMIMDKARFLGQSQTGWVNPKQTASIKVTKVMNVGVTYFERVTDVEPEERKVFRGYHYIIRAITGTIEITNRRNEEVTLHLNSLFLGKVGTIEPTPTREAISPMDYWPNDMSNLSWELTLKPGESRTITLSGMRWFRI